MELAEVTVCPPSGILGQRFGRLVVEAMTTQYRGRRRLYQCLCDCGNTVLVAKGNLQSKTATARTTSCGCKKKEVQQIFGESRFVSLVGESFGRLRVTGIITAPTKQGRGAMYLCLCSCGQAKNVRGADLRYGDTQSCGCLRKENTSRRMIEMHRRKGLAGKD
jgi:hypothetical protein